MHNTKFKTGDKVKLVGHPSWNPRVSDEIGSIGTIVGFRGRDMQIYIKGSPNNKYSYFCASDGSKISWRITDNVGVKLVEEQLLFDFMSED